MSKRAWLWLFPCACFGGVALYVCRLAPLPVGPSGSDDERAQVGEQLREREPGLRRSAMKDFPGDTWSQNDDFGNQERKFVRKQERRVPMRAGAVLDAIDRDVKAHPGQGERGTVAPCMPRPYYL